MLPARNRDRTSVSTEMHNTFMRVPLVDLPAAEGMLPPGCLGGLVLLAASHACRAD